MMFRRIAISAASATIILALLEILLVTNLTADSRFWYSTFVRATLFAMVTASAALAARAFGWWSEHVGRAWTLFFVEYGLLLINWIIRRGFPHAALAMELTLVAANLAGIGAYWLMARSLSVAGLHDDGSMAKKIVVVLLALVLAVMLCQASIADGFGSLYSADPRPGRLVSGLADVITFALVAPLLLTTLALRGGRLVWIFAFLTTGTVGWMINQGATTLATLAGGGEDAARVVRNTGFAMACFFIAAAALTQWLAARQVASGAAQ